MRVVNGSQAVFLLAQTTLKTMIYPDLGPDGSSDTSMLGLYFLLVSNSGSFIAHQCFQVLVVSVFKTIYKLQNE